MRDDLSASNGPEASTLSSGCSTRSPPRSAPSSPARRRPRTGARAARWRRRGRRGCRAPGSPENRPEEDLRRSQSMGTLQAGHIITGIILFKYINNPQLILLDK